MSSDRISGQSREHAMCPQNGQPLKWQLGSGSPSVPSVRSSLLMNEAVKVVMQLSLYKRKDKNKTFSIILLLLYAPMGGHRNSD